MLKVGITGNIASGKTQAEKIISEVGYKVFDLDKITNNLYLTSEDFKKKIKLEFGTFEKAEISKIVFNNNEKLKKLEDIIHPILKDETLRIFEENKNEDKVFISGALLFEANFDKLFDKIIYIDADLILRKERLIKRNNLSEIEALKRINAQQNNSFGADFVIKNNSDLDEFKNKIKEVLKLL